MTYQNALRYLKTFRNFEIRTDYSYGRDLNLRRMAWLLKMFGSPEKKTRFVLVGGTKGKGSTACLLSSILTHSGYRAGLYTSPHLIDPCERMRLDGRPISRKDFGGLFRTIELRLSRERSFPWGKPTYFEVMTLGALIFFAKRKVSAAILEVGLGGRLDATNAVDPMLSILTPVSFDHMAQLGNSLRLIAREKSAIVRDRGILVCGRQPVPLKKIFRRWMRAKKAKVLWAGEDWIASSIRLSEKGSFFDLKTGHECYEDLFAAFPGFFQVDNAACAVQAAELLRSGFNYKIGDRAIREGLRNARWDGRFQILSRKPLILLDGAHNGASFRALRESLFRIFPGKRITLILGLSKGKDFPRILKELTGFKPSRVIATQSDHPRNMSAEALAGKLLKRFPEVEKASSLAEALETARRDRDRDGMVLIAGSLFLAGEALKLTFRRRKV